MINKSNQKLNKIWVDTEVYQHTTKENLLLLEKCIRTLKKKNL